jgi:hypothetical protein
MVQQGQVFELARRGRDGEQLWAYRFRTGGVARGAFSVAASRVSETRALRSSASSIGYVASVASAAR